jgi:hypothetical protein
MGKKIDLTGRVFSRLTVISEAPYHTTPSGRKYVMWLCSCVCGNNITLRSSSLTSKAHKTKSCGCLSRDLSKVRFKTHGLSNTPTYTTYTAMKKRCYNSNDPAYHSYGGRGISVCDRWLEDFENFLYDMGERPEGTSIDRINTDGNYELSNCRWATKQTQQINKRKKMNTTSKFRGVSWCSYYEMFVCQVNGKKIGMFHFEEEAAEAYDNFIIFSRLSNKLNEVHHYPKDYWRF